MYYDSCTTDNTNRYTFNTNAGNSLTFVNDHYLFTTGSSNTYFYIDTNSQLTLSDVKGKTIKFKADLNPSYQVRLMIQHSVSASGGSLITTYGNYTSVSGTQELTKEIPDNATRVIFRIDCSNNNANETVDVKNIVIYLV